MASREHVEETKRRPRWFDSPNMLMLWRPNSCCGSRREPRTLLSPPPPHLSTQQLHTLSERVITKRWSIKCTFQRNSPNRSPVCTTAGPTAPVLSLINPDFHLSLPFPPEPRTPEKRIPPDLSTTLETFKRFPQLSDKTPVVAKLLFTTRYRVMRHRSVNVGNKVSVCGWRSVGERTC